LEPPPKRKKKGFLGFGGPRYKYLTRAVLDAIDDAPVKRRRWRYVVVHNSGTAQGNAKIFDYYHRNTRKMPNGMAYHFVIGNGRSSGNGEIEIGSRWTRQVNGGHVHSDYLNNIAIGICLVGDFNRTQPTTAQYEALEELTDYLRKRVGKYDGKNYPIVKAHKRINPPRWPTDCPGSKFDYRWLSRTFK
jgi:N-acetyl-anhydromuramyl-L-alanine amidase AmpD